MVRDMPSPNKLCFAGKDTQEQMGILGFICAVPAGIAAVTAIPESIVSTLLSVAFLQERPGWSAIIGILPVPGSVLMLSTEQ